MNSACQHQLGDCMSTQERNKKPCALQLWNPAQWISKWALWPCHCFLWTVSGKWCTRRERQAPVLSGFLSLPHSPRSPFLVLKWGQRYSSLIFFFKTLYFCELIEDTSSNLELSGELRIRKKSTRKGLKQKASFYRGRMNKHEGNQTMLNSSQLRKKSYFQEPEARRIITFGRYMSCVWGGGGEQQELLPQQ